MSPIAGSLDSMPIVTLKQWVSRPRPVFPERSQPLRPSEGPGPLFTAMSALSEQRDTALALLLIPDFPWDLQETNEKGEGLLSVSVGKLHASVSESQPEGGARERVFTILLNAGLDPWALNARDVCPLREAVVKGDVAFLRAYARSVWGQQPWVEPPKGQSDPKDWHRTLMDAPSEEEKASLFTDSVRERARKGHGACIQVLAKMGAPIDSPNDKGVRPLHLAQTANTVRALLDAGADPFAVDASGRTVQDAIRSLSDKSERTAALSAWTLAAASWPTVTSDAAQASSSTGSPGGSPRGTGLTDAQKHHLSLFEAIGVSERSYPGQPLSLSQRWTSADNVLVNERSADGRLLLCQAVLAQDWKAVSRLMRAGADPFLTESAGGSAVAALCSLPRKGSNALSLLPHFGNGRAFATQVFTQFLNRQWAQIEQAAGVPLTPALSTVASVTKKSYTGQEERTGPLFSKNFDWASLPKEAFQSSQELGLAFANILNPANHYQQDRFFSDSVRGALSLRDILSEITATYRRGRAFLDSSRAKFLSDEKARYPEWLMKAIGTHASLVMEPVLNAICVQGVAESTSITKNTRVHNSCLIDQRLSPSDCYFMTTAQTEQYNSLPNAQKQNFREQFETKKPWLPELCEALLPSIMIASVHDHYSGVDSGWAELAEAMDTESLMRVAASMAKTPAVTHSPTAAMWAPHFPLLFSACETQALRAPLQHREANLREVESIQPSASAPESVATDERNPSATTGRVSRRL